MWTTVWRYQEKTHLSKLHFKWVSLFLAICMATTVKLNWLVIVLHELFCSIPWMNLFRWNVWATNQSSLFVVSGMKLFSLLLSMLSVASLDCTNKTLHRHYLQYWNPPCWVIKSIPTGNILLLLISPRLPMHVLDIQWPTITSALLEIVLWTSQFWC